MIIREIHVVRRGVEPVEYLSGIVDVGRDGHPSSAVVIPVGIYINPVSNLPKSHQCELMPVVISVRVPVVPYPVKPSFAPGQCVVSREGQL